ncbi:hypothetical protein OC835_005693 [Tilletia horrida]|nr:hypothetical protein OC835_005693 [Tilletia horrida]
MARAPSAADDPLSSPLSSPPRSASAHLGHGRDPPLGSVHGDAHNGSDDEDPLPAPTSAQPQRRRPSTGSSSPLSRVKQPDLVHPSASSAVLTLDPSPFTGSQLCLNLIEPELRSAYRVAYQVAKKHVSAGTLPDWDVVWIQNCMVSYDPQVRALIRQYFDAVVQAYLSRHANSSPLAPATSASTSSAPQSAQASRAPDGSSSSRSAAAPTSALTSSAASIPTSRQLPLTDITPSVNRGSDALLTLSTAPRKAVANGEWRGFVFQGVVRWHKHAVEETAITYSEWLAEHGSAIEKDRSRRGAGSTAERSDKAKATQGQKPSRALQYGAYLVGSGPTLQAFVGSGLSL